MTPGSKTKRALFLDLSARAKLRVAGADRFRFLNGQITNDLRKANETGAMPCHSKRTKSVKPASFEADAIRAALEAGAP